jgi:hypothetical protein
MNLGEHSSDDLGYILLEIPLLLTVECAYGTEGRGFESLQPHHLQPH